MKQLKVYSPTLETDQINLIQLTDTHLFGSSQGQLLGVNTSQSFEAVVNTIMHNGHRADLVLATGDISQDYTSASYQRFANIVATLNLPCHFLPGNHDEQQLMCDNLIADHLFPQRQIVLDDWQIILLDSTIAKKPAGKIEEGEFQFIEQAINAYPEKHVLISMHHHPLKVGCSWLDQHWISNGEEFLQRVAAYKQIKGILWGHIHQQFDEVYQGHFNDIRLMATPSTCIQFTPKSDHFALDSLQPGYRVLQLNRDGKIVTTVHRLEGAKFTPEKEVSGY